MLASKKSSLERNLVVAFAVALLSIAALGFLQYRTANRLSEDNQWVSHTQDVLRELAETRNSLNRADATAQSFFITGDTSDRASFARTVTALNRHVQNLKNLTVDNPAQLNKLDLLGPLVAGSEYALQQELDSPGAGQLAQKQVLILENSVRKSNDAVRAGLTIMETAELDLLQQRNQAAQQANHRANLIIFFGSLIAGAFLTVFAVALRIDILKRSQSEAKIRQLLESAPDGMVIVNREGRIVLVNSQTEELFGYGRKELIGQPVEILIPGRYRARHLSERAKYLQEPRNWASGVKLELRGLRKDGTEFPAEISLSPMENQGEALILSAIRDISERKAAQETVEVQAKFLNAANDAIIVGDTAERIIYWNGGAERLYGWKREEAIGKSSHELLQTEFPVPFEEIASRREKGEWEGELIHRKRDGTKITVASHWTTLRNAQQKVAGWLEINRDITERKRAEEDVRALSGRLLQIQEDERRHIGRELHDNLGQYLSLLKIGLDTLHTFAKSAGNNQGQRLDECIQLAEQSLAEVRTASYLLYPPMLDELGLQSAIPMYLEGFAKRSGIQTTIEVPATIGRLPRDVELALFRALQESLTNVHRHSGSATAYVRIVGEDGNVTLEVKDVGKGIPADKLHEFDKGVPGKLGVGLRGMKERIRQCGGKLEVSSNHEGTTVRVTIPSGESKSSFANN